MEDKFNLDKRIVIFTDGACSGNPGPGGWASIVFHSRDKITELAGGNRHTTNNQMELQGVIEALSFISSLSDDISIYTDSTYVINGATKWVWGWAQRNWLTAENNPVSNKELWIKLIPLLQKHRGRLVWKYVRGHTGVVGNERCDQLAVSCSKGESLYLYEGLYSEYPYKIFPLPVDESLPTSSFSKEKRKESSVSYYISLVNGVVSKYQKWNDCERAVRGVSGAKYKKVKNEQDEKETLKSWNYEFKK